MIVRILGRMGRLSYDKPAGHGVLANIAHQIVRCRRCPRLNAYLDSARRKNPGYWCRPVPGFGNPNARIALVGLAPGMHGANKTGRMFTYDSSGKWLYEMLHESDLSSSPVSKGPGDGLKLKVWITNAARCAPPDNKPSSEELDNCRIYLIRELVQLRRLRVIVALGRIGHEAVLKAYGIRLADREFHHLAVHRVQDYWLVDSYHPSRQNTNTGKLTKTMWRSVFKMAVKLAKNPVE